MLSLSVGIAIGSFKASVGRVLNMLPLVEENTKNIDAINEKLDGLQADKLVKAYSNSLQACTKRLNHRIEG